MEKHSICPVILAGGHGTRLWPLSRTLHPKQFWPLTGERSMLQETMSRLGGVEAVVPARVICNQAHRFTAAAQLSHMNIQDAHILLEPVGRNTAPAIAVAALHALQGGEDVVLLVLAADHAIRDIDAFHAALGVATLAAADGALVTFGIKPHCAETGYGYLQVMSPVATGTCKIERFVEKPDPDTARAFLAAGDYFWNSGMFMFRASVYLDELARRAPAMLDACRRALAGATTDLGFLVLDPAAYTACPEDSIDYAVMEKTERAVMVPLDAGWSDLGSWRALWAVADKDEHGNAQRGDVLVEDSRNCYLHGANRRLLTVVGLDDVIVVDTDDVVLVAHKNQVQQVKHVVERLRQLGRREVSQHRVIWRPWGYYDAMDSGPRYQVKRITVNPGGKLSLQMHYHRAEHWVVVSGTARVIIGEQEQLLTENQSVYIPLGTMHSLENPGKILLEMIEVQTGAYLGEDDIVRFQDAYGRA